MSLLVAVLRFPPAREWRRRCWAGSSLHFYPLPLRAFCQIHKQRLFQHHLHPALHPELGFFVNQAGGLFVKLGGLLAVLLQHFCTGGLCVGWVHPHFGLQGGLSFGRAQKFDEFVGSGAGLRVGMRKRKPLWAAAAAQPADAPAAAAAPDLRAHTGSVILM